MRVALITQSYETGGGVPAITRWLRTGLMLAGHEVDVHDLAASYKDGQSRRILAPNTWRAQPTVMRIRTDHGLYHWGANWTEFEKQRYRPRAELTKALNNYDLIQVVAGGPALALAVSKATPPKALQFATSVRLEVPARLSEMAWIKRASKSLNLRSLNRLEVVALRAMDLVFVENRLMERWVLGHGQPNVAFAPPGIDTELFHPMGAWDPTKPIIAFGRLGESRKDWPTAVRAYERFVGASGASNRLVLAGKGPMAPSLVSALAESPVRHRIDVREDVPGEVLPSLLAAGSVFLQSSLEEGLGLAGLEAMACGLPIVATRTVGSSEYVRDGENGYLVDLGSAAVEGLAVGLARVLNPVDGGRMAQNAIRTVLDEYSHESALEVFLSSYNHLLGRGKA